MSRTRRANVLRALESGPKTTAELCQPEVGGERFGGRIEELRKAGYLISTQRLTESNFLYRLTGRPPTIDQGVDLMCSRRHHWKGRVRYCQSGYPLASTAGPDCPTCGHPPVCVEGPIQPARADVVAAIHDLRDAA